MLSLSCSGATRVRVQLLLGLFVLLLGACATPAATPSLPPLPTTPTVTEATLVPPEATPVRPTTGAVSPSPAPAQSADLAHRIGVRVTDGTGEFYDRLTGEKFIPRGFNYVRLAPMSATKPGLWHSTLSPGLYEPERAEAAVQAMHDAGYNVVRVFVDCCREGNNAGNPRGGISQAYLANVIDFLDKAKANEIQVLLVLDLTPAQGGYDEMWAHCCTFSDGENLRYLTSGGHTGERRFDHDFIQALIDKNAPLDAIFAFDLTNEVHFSVDKPPLSLSAGKVTTANHETYDMASADDKQRMMDENLVYWIDQMRANILEVDPTALVTVSFPAINSGDTTVNPWPAILESTADFVDLHAYMGWGLSFEQYMQRFGVDGPTGKPLILGEFGAERRAYRTAEMAARALTAWQAESCQYGFDGWLLWTWDGEEQESLWHATSENGEIGRALSPLEHPDPCDPAALIQETTTALPTSVAAQVTSAPAPIVRSGWVSYSSGNGIRDLALDHEGNLWTATTGGAVLWRGGGTYTKYTWEHGLAGNSVHTVVVAPDGAVWFGANGGVSSFDGQAWQTYTASDGLAGNYVISSAVASDGTLWFGTFWSGISRFDGESWTNYAYLKTPGFEASGPVIALAVTSDGTLWAAGNDSGLLHFDGREWKFFKDRDGMITDGHYNVLAASEGDLWAGVVVASSGELGLVHFDGQVWRSHIAPGSRVVGQIQAIAVGPEGKVWLSTRDDLFTFDGEKWESFGLSGVTSILAAAGGPLWFGTVSKGVLNLTDQGLVALITDDHLDPRGVRNIAVAPTGDMWFGGPGGVASLDGQRWRSYGAQEGLAGDDVRAVAVAPDGAVWVGTESGASRFFAGQWTTFATSNSGLANNDVLSIAIDQLGAVWFGTSGGASRFDGDSWVTYTTADGLANERVFAAVVDNQGDVWLATDDGISRFDGQSWTTYTGDDGLWNTNASTLAVSPSGQMWIGRVNGLVYFDGQEWVSVPVADGLDSPLISSIAFAADGSLWCGLMRLGTNPSYGAGRYDGREWTILSVGDGLGHVDVNAIAVGPDGSVWFGTPAGASRLSPP